MKVLVTGCGRGGTNLGSALLRSFRHFNFITGTNGTEDRGFFNKGNLADLYATKLATENKGFTLGNLERSLTVNSDLYVVFMLRHPLDILLSKILRGLPASEGGDSTINQVATDGTPDGAFKAIRNMHEVFSFLEKFFPSRLHTIKLESLTFNPTLEIDRLSSFLDLPLAESTSTFYENNGNAYQQARYKGVLHPQVSLYKDLEENFNGFFGDKKDMVNDYKDKLERITNHLSY
tara:strand:- start:829 stop:1530 length:702 start_codon:yes stop_codon:yes gene_type:complete